MTEHRKTVIALACTTGVSAGERARREGGDEHAVRVAAFRGARSCWLRPSDEEAFIAGCGALVDLFPEQERLILAEAEALGEYSKVMQALIDGVPVDMERVEIPKPPEGALGLVALFDESREETR